MPGDKLYIDETLAIEPDELIESFSRSSGPGGQHVNKTETKVELKWHPMSSIFLDSLHGDKRAHFLSNIKLKLSKEGFVIVVSSDHRSQKRNRDEARRKLRQIVLDACKIPVVRKPTKPSRAKKEKRLNEKRRRSMQKKERQWKKNDE